jgi:hypothetical protein
MRMLKQQGVTRHCERSEAFSFVECRRLLRCARNNVRHAWEEKYST